MNRTGFCKAMILHRVERTETMKSTLIVACVLIQLVQSIQSNEQDTVCKSTKMGKEYTGKAAVTKTGKTCQSWTSQTPHSHDRTTANGFVFPDGSDAAAKNFCRNPDNWAEGVWCYTTDPESRWELCSVPFCKTGCTSTQMGKEYTGTVAVTKTGKTCQRWDSQSPHQHTRTTANGHPFPDGSDEAAMNFCRNPDDWPEGVWCYTTDPESRWELCDVPRC
jgi:integrin beta 3